MHYNNKIGDEKESTFSNSEEESESTPGESLAHLVSKPIFEEESTAENHHDNDNRHHKGSARRHEGPRQEHDNDAEEEGMRRKSNKDDHNHSSRMNHHREHNNDNDFDVSPEKYHGNDKENDESDNQFINENTGFDDGEFYDSLPSPSNGRRRGRIITTSASKENPKALYEQIRMYIKRSKIPKRSKMLQKRSRVLIRSKVAKGNHKHKRSHVNHHHSPRNKNNRRSKMTKTPSSKSQNHYRNEISRVKDSRTVITKKTVNKPANITTRDDVVATHFDNLHHDEDTAIVNGETEANNYGTQFSDPYHSESKGNGNNGYAKGEYFGSDTPDTGDNVPLLGSAAGSRDAAAFFANDNGAALVKSFMNGGGGVHSDGLLDSGKFDGFENHHQHYHASGNNVLLRKVEEITVKKKLIEFKTIAVNILYIIQPTFRKNTN